MSTELPDDFSTNFTASRIVRAWEPPEEVVIPRALAESRALDYDDYGILIRLLIRDPHQPSSVLGLLEEFRASGWTLSERDLRKIMRRLKKAGHVEHKREYNSTTKRPEWVFRVYRNPANNGTYVGTGVDEASQVRPIGTPCPGRSPEATSDRDTLSGCAGQADRDTLSGSEPIGTPCPDRKLSNIAGQADRDTLSGSDASPPHPPGGGTTPPPNPLTHTDGAQEHPSQTEEGGVFDTKDIEAATAFLQQLPDPWVIGQKDATDMAPELLTQMHVKQWPSIHAVNRKQLESCLATNPGGANNLPSILRRRRIPNLPAYSRVADRAARATVPKQAPSAPAVVECDKGCDRGYIEIEDRVAACSCLPLRQASTT